MKIFVVLFFTTVILTSAANDADEYSGFLSTTKWGFNLGPSFYIQDSTQDAAKLSFQQKFLFTGQTAFSYNIDWFAPHITFGGNIIYDIVAFHYKRFTPNIGLGVGFNYAYQKSNSSFKRNPLNPYLIGIVGFLFQVSQNTTFQIQIPYYFGLNRSIFRNNLFKNNQEQRIGVSLGILFSSSYTHVRKWIP